MGRSYRCPPKRCPGRSQRTALAATAATTIAWGCSQVSRYLTQSARQQHVVVKNALPSSEPNNARCRQLPIIFLPSESDAYPYNDLSPIKSSGESFLASVPFAEVLWAGPNEALHGQPWDMMLVSLPGTALPWSYMDLCRGELASKWAHKELVLYSKGRQHNMLNWESKLLHKRYALPAHQAACHFQSHAPSLWV